MTRNTQRSRLTPARLVGLCTLAILAQSCSGGGGGGGSSDGGGGNSGKSYLAVSHADVYFGTRDVGSNTSQKLTLENQSADVYPILSIALDGPDAGEFDLTLKGDMPTLNPGEQFQVDLSFLPASAGPKQSAINIGHDIVVKANDTKNRAEQSYYEARKLERVREYDKSLAKYQDYIATQPETPNKQRASVRVPVLTESSRQGDSGVMHHYTRALAFRDIGRSEDAIQDLDTLLDQDDAGYMADDALYLKGYIYLADLKAYQDAYDTMLELRFRFPESSYYDTALYVEAIAQQEMGDVDLARELFDELRRRHTGLSIEMFNLEWPKDNYLSRLWFERGSQALAALDS
ncbi:MAG TPA: hypothetical protein DD979_02535 [Gammaproteobacteria bacterium]|nr:hypothetical protein [Gammaproteobacteria bacterium]